MESRDNSAPLHKAVAGRGTTRRSSSVFVFLKENIDYPENFGRIEDRTDSCDVGS